MAGQIVKRSERTWIVRVFLGRDPRTGKRKYCNKTVHGTRKDAQAYLNGVLRDQDLGRFVEPTKLRLDAFLARWLEEVAKPKLRESTFNGYADVVRLYVSDSIGSQLLNELTPFKLQSYYAKLREQKVGVATLKKLHVVIASSLDQALHWGLLGTNPAKSVKVANLRSGLREDKVRVLNPEEAKRFLEAAQEQHHGLALILALSTGMRPGEYLALLWKDIDLDNGRLVVQRVISASDPISGRGLTLQSGHHHAEDCSYDLHAHGTPIPGNSTGESRPGTCRLAREQPRAKAHSNYALESGCRAG